MKKIKYNGNNTIVKNNNPKFEIEFNDEPVEVDDDVAEVLLRNPDFEDITKKKGD